MKPRRLSISPATAGLSRFDPLEKIQSKKQLQPIVTLHDEINGCSVCSEKVPGYLKPPPLYRGELGRIMIVGQGPGNAELTGSTAFAGSSGKRLDAWLIASGANKEKPREGIYLTSVIKCFCPHEKYFSVMANNCADFLFRQITEIHPELIITLGKKAYEALRATDHNYESALCTPISTEEVTLLTPFGFHFKLLHWPHPSGLNHWHNESKNRDRLEKSFEVVSSYIRGR